MGHIILAHTLFITKNIVGKYKISRSTMCYGISVFNISNVSDYALLFLEPALNPVEEIGKGLEYSFKNVE